MNSSAASSSSLSSSSKGGKRSPPHSAGGKKSSSAASSSLTTAKKKEPTKGKPTAQKPETSSSAKKASVPTQVWIGGLTDKLSHEDVASAVEQFGKTKSFLLFRPKQQAMVMFEKEQDAKKLRSAKNFQIKGHSVTIIKEKGSVSKEEKSPCTESKQQKAPLQKSASASKSSTSTTASSTTRKAASTSAAAGKVSVKGQGTVTGTKVVVSKVKKGPTKVVAKSEASVKTDIKKAAVKPPLNEGGNRPAKTPEGKSAAAGAGAKQKVKETASKGSRDAGSEIKASKCEGSKTPKHTAKAPGTGKKTVPKLEARAEPDKTIVETKHPEPMEVGEMRVESTKVESSTGVTEANAAIPEAVPENSTGKSTESQESPPTPSTTAHTELPAKGSTQQPQTATAAPENIVLQRKDQTEASQIQQRAADVLSEATMETNLQEDSTLSEKTETNVPISEVASKTKMLDMDASTVEVTPPVEKTETKASTAKVTSTVEKTETKASTAKVTSTVEKTETKASTAKVTSTVEKTETKASAAKAASTVEKTETKASTAMVASTVEKTETKASTAMVASTVEKTETKASTAKVASTVEKTETKASTAKAASTVEKTETKASTAEVASTVEKTETTASTAKVTSIVEKTGTKASTAKAASTVEKTETKASTAKVASTVEKTEAKASTAKVTSIVEKTETKASTADVAPTAEKMETNASTAEVASTVEKMETNASTAEVASTVEKMETNASTVEVASTVENTETNPSTAEVASTVEKTETKASAGDVASTPEAMAEPSASTAPAAANSPLTVGEMLHKDLRQARFVCLKIKSIFSPNFFSNTERRQLLITGLPLYFDGCYTEDDIAKLFKPFGFQHHQDTIYVFPQCQLALVMMPTIQCVHKVMKAFTKNRRKLKGNLITTHVIENRISMTPIGFYKSLMKRIKFQCSDDDESIIYIKNISPSQIKELREKLWKIDSVKNFLPLLNKVFVEFESSRDADRLGVWHSFLNQTPPYEIHRLMQPHGIVPALPPRLTAKAIPDSANAVPGVVIPGANFGIPQGSICPFWIPMTTRSFLFPTMSPWFIIPNFRTVKKSEDIYKMKHCSSPTIMLTGLPEGNYSHLDIAKLVWPYFPKQTLQSLLYNIIVLTLQRRAFVHFYSWLKCLDFVREHIANPISVKGAPLSVHFVLQNMSPIYSEENMYKSLTKLSNTVSSIFSSYWSTGSSWVTVPV
ncbi:uncharacterized protein LOC115438944 [Sphaeramia orbicularis]|uniref:uncharacterized protein LOC115438944 n=1 Tax=Sphaeramia orbicularis TaxID=375764 RepID=UPI00117F5C4F|nr:uncharacterized protein LOC115438944 [Sphaeramia orbicularis]